MNRKKLSDVLKNSDREELSRAWSEATAAQEFGPLPPGEYVAHIIEGAVSTAKTGTPSYKLTFRVAEGEFAGCQFWHDIWLTPQSIPMAKRNRADYQRMHS